MTSRSCGTLCIKCLLVIFNAVFMMIGGLLLAVGIWYLVEPTSLQFVDVSSDASLTSLFRAAAIVLTTVGAVIVVVGVIGCAAICRESSTGLIVFATVLVVIIITEVVVAVLAGIYRNQWMSKFDDVISTAFQNSYGQDSRTTETINSLQVELKCCGVSTPSNWSTSWWKTHVANNSQPVPLTCCTLTNNDASNPQPVNVTACYIEASSLLSSSKFLHSQGCQSALESWMSTRSAVLIGIAVGVIALQIVHIILVCCLSNDVRNRGIFN